MRLIDDDALLKKFDDTEIQITFDLSVEEIFGDDIDDFTMLVQDAIQAYRKMVIATIEEQPTAYDVDKVVLDIYNEKLSSVNANPNNMNEVAVFCKCKSHFANIVKAGGTDGN